MLTLPADIQLLILDHITSNADLKELCVTSKACRNLALPRLYHYVNLITWDSDQSRLKRFVRCMSKGAGLHLQHTRIWTLQNTMPPSEPQCQLTGRLEFKQDVSSKTKDGPAPAETVDSFVLVLLEMFPEHRLRQFGYISDESISQQIMTSLIKKQKNLEQVQLSWGTILGSSRKIKHLDFQPLFRNLRALDVYVTGPREVESLIEELAKDDLKLERLALGMADGVALAIQDYILLQAMHRTPSSPNLKDCTLRGLKLDHYTCALWKPIMNLAKLQHLTVSNCSGIDQFILEDVALEFSVGALSLRHLAIELEADPDALVAILDRCHLLESLHVKMPSLPRTDYFLDALKPHAASLRTLALHERDATADQDEEDPISPHDFKKICKVGRNVHYFGFQLSPHELDPADWNAGDDGFATRLRSMKIMRGLRVIHFRLPQSESVDVGNITFYQTQAHVTWELQKFSNGVFEYMDRHKACPDLKAIVIGHHSHVGPGSHLGEEMVEWFYPRHCFIKGYQIDVLQRRTAVAVPVPAYRIQELEPGCDLLDYDPECEWVGGLPGRFHFLR
ncbi:hypothetical protein CC86DRAFT_399721 [Ophiobolus disseminans]|uniref:F-box domain-containing protein n=1 Tax=Ophiobolus disseminans TaxID=1469910 RepID=A0A6A7AID3_9PLEO|nr:hypothetical protein CC86DRAFT_399721 [Ophiobolus disseminans]